MIAQPVAHLLADLGVTRSHNRPHTSNDYSSSESQFKTMQYRPDYPWRFGCYEDARVWCERFFRWCNQSTGTRGSASTPQLLSTMDELARSGTDVPGCSMLPGGQTRIASCARGLSRRHYPRRSGSTPRRR